MSDNNDPWREFSQLRGFMGAKYSIFDHPGGYIEGRAAAGGAAVIIMIPIGICYGIYEGAKWIITHVPNELTLLPIGAAIATTAAFSDRIAWPKSARITTAAAATAIVTGLPSIFRVHEGVIPGIIGAHPVASLDIAAASLAGMAAYLHSGALKRNRVKSAAIAAALALTTTGAATLKYVNDLPTTIERQPFQSTNTSASVVTNNSIKFYPFNDQEGFNNSTRDHSATYNIKTNDFIELPPDTHVLSVPCEDNAKVCEAAIYVTNTQQPRFGVIPKEDEASMRREEPNELPRLAVKPNGTIFFNNPEPPQAPAPAPTIITPPPDNSAVAASANSETDTTDAHSSDTALQAATSQPPVQAQPSTSPTEVQTFRAPVSVYRPDFDQGIRVTGTSTHTITAYFYYGNFSLAYIHSLNPVSVPSGTTVTRDWCSTERGFCEVFFPDSRSFALIDLDDNKYIRTANTSNDQPADSDPSAQRPSGDNGPGATASPTSRYQAILAAG